ncbi:MAG: hypothetical protein OHK0039_48260 [Bacteroidia bacterium]
MQIIYLVLSTYFLETSQVDMLFRVEAQQRLAHIIPALWDTQRQVGHISGVGQHANNGLGQASQTVIFDGKIYFPAEHIQARIVLPDCIGVVGKSGDGVAFFVQYHQDRQWCFLLRVHTQQVDNFEPVSEVGGFPVPIGKQDIERSAGQEELMGRVLDFLAAKVPHMDDEIFAQLFGM